MWVTNMSFQHSNLPLETGKDVHDFVAVGTEFKAKFLVAAINFSKTGKKVYI